MRHRIPKLEHSLIDSCKASEFFPVLDEQRGLFPPQPHLAGAFFSPVLNTNGLDFLVTSCSFGLPGMTPDAFGRIDKQLILPVSTSVRGTAPT